MFIRLLIYGVLGFLLYRVVKSRFGSVASVKSGNSRSSYPGDDEMIKDPVCGAYFSRREAVVLNGSDKKMFFCSPECRDRYLASMEK